MQILVIPLEDPSHPCADVRLVPIIPILRSKGKIVGLQLIHSASFDTVKNLFSIKKLCGAISLIYYIVRAFIHGLRHIKSTDLIFCEHLYSAVIGSFLSFLSCRPCIWDSHGNILEACNELGDSKVYKRIVWLLERIIRNYIDVLVVPTELDRRLYIAQGFNPNKIKVITCGLDLSTVDIHKDSKENLRNELNLDTEVPIILFTGKRTYLPNKEAAWWINDILAPYIKEHFGDVKIIITGSGEVPQVQHESVIFTGFVTNVFKYIFASDLCLVPVHLDNGLSTKLLDFMACGKPTVILSTVTKGMPEIKDGKHTFIAKDLDDFLIKTKEALLSNRIELSELGNNSRILIEKHYNWKNIRKEWDELINIVTDNKRSGNDK